MEGQTNEQRSNKGLKQQTNEHKNKETDEQINTGETIKPFKQNQ